MARWNEYIGIFKVKLMKSNRIESIDEADKSFDFWHFVLLQCHNDQYQIQTQIQWRKQSEWEEEEEEETAIFFSRLLEKYV